MRFWRVLFVSCAVLIISVNGTGKKKKQQKGMPKHPQKTPEEIKKIFEENKIVPDVIDTAPQYVLKIGYTKIREVVNFGNNITREQSRDEPTSILYPGKHGINYTLIMIDPDYPSREERKKDRQWHHWLVVDIPGNNIAKGTVLSEYLPVEAKNNTGRHRYVFLLYQQPEGEIKYEEIHTIAIPVDSLRAPFSCREFAAKYNMTGPIAGNFFMSQFGRLWPREEVDPKYAREQRIKKQGKLEKDYTKMNYKNKRKKSLF